MAELCKALNVSAGLLLGLECRSEPVGSELSMYPQVYSEKVRVIESLEIALYRNPNASIETLAEQVCVDLETSDSIAIFLANR